MTDHVCHWQTWFANLGQSSKLRKARTTLECSGHCEANMTTLRQKLFPTKTARLERLPSVLARTGLSRSSIYKKVANGEFPRPVKLGERAVAWSADAVTDWINVRLNSNEAP